MCWVPAFSSMLSNESGAALPYCAQFDEFRTSLGHLTYALERKEYANITGIIQLTEILHYKVTTRRGIIVEEDSFLYLFYESLAVAVEEEYLLLDLNGLVASIGGWLGLLVGMSCYGMGEMLLDHGQSYLMRFK